jgi:uncharacterized membrane protein YfcA
MRTDLLADDPRDGAAAGAPSVNALQALAVIAAGFAAGAINTIVGSGSLITFPTLLAIGYPSVTANVSNTIGLSLGNVSGVIGYRAELRGQRRRVTTLAFGSAAGALLGGILLLALPTSVFDAVVPALILLASGLMAFKRTPKTAASEEHLRIAVVVAFFTGIYGGYFGAAQGVILLAAMRLCFTDDLQRLNGVKNVLAGVANGVAAILFILVADVAWDVAALIAVSSIIGAQVGAKVGRRLPERVLRWTVVSVGTIVAIVLFLT